MLRWYAVGHYGYLSCEDLLCFVIFSDDADAITRKVCHDAPCGIYVRIFMAASLFVVLCAFNACCHVCFSIVAEEYL